ncbi:hypothetical protein [Streptomyces sp. NPDC046261]|uniref:hypothetical protein n=1 Tax=Streptomyces sp. NPDC046261 TaxID=3157200 RepID=UPI0033C37CE4
MRRMNVVVAVALAVIAFSGTSASASAVRTAPAAHSPAGLRADQPPFPYKDCLSAAKQHGESPAYAKWHCDELVKKGWVKRPQA